MALTIQLTQPARVVLSQNPVTVSFGSALFAYPLLDLTDGSWTPSLGTDLFATVDEVTTNDADYMQSNTGDAGDQAVLSFGPLTTPASPVKIQIRHKAP